MWYAIQTVSGKEKEVVQIYNSTFSILEADESVFSLDREVFVNVRKRDFTKEQLEEYEARKELRDKLRNAYKAQKSRKREKVSDHKIERVSLRIFNKLELPVFPSYIFLETPSILSFRKRLYSSEGQRLRELLCVRQAGGYMVDAGRSLRKSKGTIDFEDRFICLDDKSVKYFMQLGGEDHVIRHSTCVLKGNMVRITDGPLMGMEGELLKINMHKREVKLLIEFLGEKRTVSLGMELVRDIT